MTQEPTANAAQALRDAGFMPLPRLWVRNEDMPKVYSIINSVGLEVREIRRVAREHHEASLTPKTINDPVTDKDAAWAAYEKARSGY